MTETYLVVVGAILPFRKETKILKSSVSETEQCMGS